MNLDNFLEKYKERFYIDHHETKLLEDFIKFIDDNKFCKCKLKSSSVNGMCDKCDKIVD